MLAAPYFFVNLAPGAGWNQNRPESITDRLFREPVAALGAGVRARVGVSFIFSYCGGPPERTEATLRKVLDASRRNRVPVLLTFDGENWWDFRPDLWNWWDPARPGYDPRNRENVEWTGWSPGSAVRIGWRNWGRQSRVLPAPNLASPRFREATHETLLPLLRVVRDWARSLPKEDAWLFPGVKVGWEASVGINAYHYAGGDALADRLPSEDPTIGLDPTKGLSGGLDLLGYSALTSMHRRHPGPATKADQEAIASDYLGFLARTAAEAGLPRDRIFTHAGGQYAPYERHVSHRTAVNRFSIPGWSLYGVSPTRAGDLAKAVGHGGAWCAAEWLPNARTPYEWRSALEDTIGFRDCRFVCLYNWEGIKDRPDAIAGLRSAVGSP